MLQGQGMVTVTVTVTVVVVVAVTVTVTVVVTARMSMAKTQLVSGLVLGPAEARVYWTGLHRLLDSTSWYQGWC